MSEETAAAAPAGGGAEESNNVKVICRVRPFNTRELTLDANCKSVVYFDGDTVRVLDHERGFQEKEAFSFDHAFWSMPESQGQFSPNAFADQETVFSYTGAPAVDNAMRGFHNTIFAYGQTGSGKTYTMLGSERDEGVAPRLVRRLFACIREKSSAFAAERVECKVELSFLEIYNEKVKDLLAKAEKQAAAAQARADKRAAAAAAANNSDTSSLSSAQSQATFAPAPHAAPATEYADCRVRFHPEKGTFVEGLMRLEITDENQCLSAIKSGMEHRAVTSTLMNDTSSRSHAIFQICLTQKMPLKGTTRVSQINLVDLAGSERIKMSGVQGQALSEAKNINLSLSTLRRVIDVLIENSIKAKKGQKPNVPPFRESLLTWVLSDSLGGNSKTVMVAAISPYAGNIEDTLGTLRYALKAKAIVCHAKVNEEKTAAVVHQLRAEMDELRRQLEAKADTDKAERERIEIALQQREEDFGKMQGEMKRLDELRGQYEQELIAKASELEKAQEQIQALENVEEEKSRREEELRKARELQEETERLLREQEDERKRRDAELAAVLERKNALKERHDKAAEEEARARLAAEQARMRQFATAFQNAFILGKQRSGLEELREEADSLEKKVSKLEADVKDRETALTQLTSDKVVLARKVEMLERKCQQMQAELERVMATKHEKINELSTQKHRLEEQLSAAQQDLNRKRTELQSVQDLYKKESEDLTAQMEALAVETEDVKKETEAKLQRRDYLAKNLSASEEKLAGLTKTAEELEATARELRQGNDRKRAELAELERRRQLQEKLRDEAQTTLAKKRDEIASLRKELETTTTETDALRKSHAELREFVAHKFFPPGATRATTVAGGGPPPGRSHSPHHHVSPSSKPVGASPSGGTRSISQHRSPSIGHGHSTPLTPSVSHISGSAHAPRLSSPSRVRVWQNGGYRYVDPATATALEQQQNTPRRPTPTRSNGSQGGPAGSTPRARSPAKH